MRMPQIWSDNTIVVDWEELVPIHYNTLGALQKELKRFEAKPYGIKKAQSGGNGRRLLVYFDSLAPNIQKDLGDPRKACHPLEPLFKIDAQAVDYYSTFQRYDGSMLHDTVQQKYYINASVLKAVLILKELRETERIKMGGKKSDIIKTLCYDVQNFNPVLLRKYNLTHNLPANPRKFAEKLKQFIDFEYVALVKDIKGTGKQNARIVTDEMVEFLNNLFATQSHKPTQTEVAEQYDGFLAGYVEVINNKTGEVYEPKQFKKISKGTITKYLAQWKNQIGTHAKRSGDRQKLMQKFKPYHSLINPEFAGSLISIDDRQPPFEYDKSKRLWFYNGIDLASGAFTCWVYGKTKEGLILDFYRQLVRNYHEWGFQLPFGLECESSLNSSFTETFLREGTMFQDVRIEANNARGKRIEAYYRPLRYDLEKKREGWLARPHALSEANQLGSTKKIILPYERIVNECLNDIVIWNNMPSTKDKTVSRWDYFVNNQDPNARPTNYKAFLQHLGHKSETSCKAGIVKFQYSEFLLGDNGMIYTGDKLIRLMNEVEGKKIEVFWLDDNYGEIFKALIYRNGKYICEARPKPRYNRAKNEQTEDDLNAQKIMSAYVATIEAYQREQVRTIEKVTVIDNRPVTVSTSFQLPGMGAQRKARKSDNEAVENLGNMDTGVELATLPNYKSKTLIDRF
ncbi:hypothetical protein BWK62_09495 [Flavobacterium oreochromis]|uniref:Uncharacterized protein n=2 Tax=Flavobacterium TaxID=237 RepID=A0A246G9Y2_9FLAO|nr:hypothetical protein BWK62_09495 [Flavobacterium oreochromis]